MTVNPSVKEGAMAAAKRKAGAIDVRVGRNVKRIREQLGATQDDLAQALRESGWQASGLTVFALERGERVLSFEEALLLGDVFNVPVTELLAGERAEFIQVGTLHPENTKFLRDRLVKTPRRPSTTWDETQRHRKHVQIDTGGYIELVSAREAESYAAERLGVPPEEVVRRSFALWEQSLTEERDARTAKRIAPDASPRSRRTVRGHVSRELLAELEEQEQ
jgi:transcriptional regulator with XRE-family HTH domain